MLRVCVSPSPALARTLAILQPGTSGGVVDDVLMFMPQADGTISQVKLSRTPTDPWPAQRAFHTCGWDSDRRSMLVFGGTLTPLSAGALARFTPGQSDELWEYARDWHMDRPDCRGEGKLLFLSCSTCIPYSCLGVCKWLDVCGLDEIWQCKCFAQTASISQESLGCAGI